MKKLLALVLALVMTLSLCVTSNAAFADAADIEHDEAVEAMYTLGVINGKPENKFDPKGNVTRAEMAKMITIIMLGDVDAAAFVGTATGLKDIAGHWAEGYIQYCYSQGVIAGKGNGIFDPNANVTAAEAAKMLLVAIGFDADIQEYTGANWTLNVTRDAQVKGFYDELKNLTSGETLSRDKAAQMIWNAVQADGVKITKSWNNLDNKIGYTYSDTDSLLVSTFGAVTAEKTQLTGITKVTSGEDKGTYTLTVSGGTNLGTTTINKVSGDYSALLGQKVNVMFYDKNKDGNYDANEKIFGVYPSYEDAAVTVAQSAVTKEADYKIKADGTVYELDKTNVVWTLSVTGTLNTAAASNQNAADFVLADSIANLTLVDTDTNGKYDLVIVAQADYAQLTYADSAKVIAGANTYTFEDHVIYDGAAKKDYVKLAYNLSEDEVELTKVEKQTAKLTATKATNKYQLDGQWVYSGSAMTIGQTYDYYVINNVVVKFDQTTAVDLTSLVFVAAVDSNTVRHEALIYFTDGTSKVVTVDKTTSGYDIPVQGDFATVTETSYGFKFKGVDQYDGYTTADAIFTDYTFTAGVAADVDGNPVNNFDTLEIADNAVIFVLSTDSDTAKVITGKQLKTIACGASTDQIKTQSYGTFKTKVNGLEKATIAAVEWNDSGSGFAHFGYSTSAAKYALVTAAPETYDDYIQYTVWTGSENVTVKDKDKNSVNKFAIVGYSDIDADGYISVDSTVANFQNYDANQVVAASEWGSGAVQGFEKTSTGYNLYIDGVTAGEKFTTDSDTVFMVINSAAKTADAIGVADAAEVKVADKVYGYFCDNVMVLADSSSLAKVVVFDATNRLALGAANSLDLANDTSLTVYDADDNVVAVGLNKVKPGDILTLKNETSAPIIVVTADNVMTATATPAAATGTIPAGASLVVVVTGVGDVNLSLS